MKKQYSSPILTIHGSFEAITKATGTKDLNDQGYFDGQPFGKGDGSVDGDLFGEED